MLTQHDELDDVYHSYIFLHFCLMLTQAHNPSIVLIQSHFYFLSRNYTLYADKIIDC